MVVSPPQLGFCSRLLKENLGRIIWINVPVNVKRCEFATGKLLEQGDKYISDSALTHGASYRRQESVQLAEGPRGAQQQTGLQTDCSAALM